MARVVIIGGGLTGISTAYHLEQQQFFDYTLFEKEAAVGGLCRSLEQDGFTFDFTGHLLHASDDYFYQLMQHIIGLDQMNVIDRRSFIYSHDTYTKYPFQINLHGLPTQVIVECITEFVKRTHNPNPTNFREWVVSQFGAGIGKHFFFTFQEKIFAHPIEQITASWTGRFVPQTTLEHMLHGSLSDQKEQSVGYNARFLYPKKGGIQRWVHTFAQQLKQPIATDYCVQNIDMQKKIVIFSNGHSEPYEYLINTMPLNRLLHIIKEPSSLNVNQARIHLKCNKVVTFNLGVNQPNVSDKHWIYFPEKKYPFYRLGFWHNFSEHMAPPGHSSLYGEFAYMDESPEWIQQTLKKSLKTSKKLLAISDSDIVTEKIITIPHAYVTYDHWREENLPNLLQALRKHALYSVGRYGAWKYSSMQEAVLDGRDIAQEILSQNNKTSVSQAKKEMSYEKNHTARTTHSHIT